jgi:hypothetical protein
MARLDGLIAHVDEIPREVWRLLRRHVENGGAEI